MYSDTKSLFNKNNFRRLRRYNYFDRDTSYRDDTYPYRPFKAVAKDVKIDKPKELLNINQKFVKLIGEDVFIAYSKRAGFLED